MNPVRGGACAAPTAAIVVDNIGLLCTMDGGAPYGLGMVAQACVHTVGDRIAYAGPANTAPPPPPHAMMIDAHGCCALPGLVDCHTHLPFIGTRADEFARRARGESYAAIMAAGGGIRSTTTAVRDASAEELVAATTTWMQQMLTRGVTTVEMKTGYGLRLQDERKQLLAIATLADAGPIAIAPTWMGAHAVPFEFDGDPDGYINHLVTVLPAIVELGVATSCDVFIERGAFSVEQARRLLLSARSHGLQLKVHAEQLSHTGAAKFAADIGAVAAGHLEFISEDDALALANANVVCEVLSTAQVFLRGQRAIPGRMLGDAGCKLAVASDFNPGTAMSADLLLAAGLAVTQCGLTADEALLGITAHGAAAIGCHDRGRVIAGMRADLLILTSPSPYDLVYQWGTSHTDRVIIGGVVVHERD
jgi:imidazolonepropionase